MTIAAVPMGAAVLDVPRRGDVLVIKERVGNLTTPGSPVATTRRRDFASRAKSAGGLLCLEAYELSIDSISRD